MSSRVQLALKPKEAISVFTPGEGLRKYKNTGTRGAITTRGLATIDLNTGVTSLTNDLGEKFAGITFDCTGQLYGVTGDGSSTPESLFTIDKTNASISLLATLGNGSDGETIGFNTADGLLYTRSGRSTNSSFYSINPGTGASTQIGGTTLDEAFAMLWDPVNNYFLEFNIDKELVTTQTDGTQAIIANGISPYYKGLAWVPALGCGPIVNNADLSIAISDSPDPVVAGNNLTYTVTVNNNGPDEANNVNALNTLPTGVTFVSTNGCAEDPGGVPSCNLGTIANGANTQYSLTVSVDSSTTGSITHSASVTSDADHPDISNNTSTATTINSKADLSITKSDDIDPIVAGNTLTYTISVSNNGPSDAQSVSVTDNLPTGVTLASTHGCSEDPNGVPSCSLGSLASGSSSQYTVAVAIDPNSQSMSITNNASVSSATADPDNTNNSTSEDTAIQEQLVDLQLDITTSAPSPIFVGQTFDALLELSNAGPQDGTNIFINGTLLPELKFKSRNCATSTPGGFNWNVGGLSQGSTTNCFISLRMNAEGDLTILANANADQTDPNTTNNLAISLIVTGLLLVIPTVSNYGLFLFAGLLLLFAWTHIRRKHS
ncbi:MAG: IPTL-CTERM sorting domain-containing protein [bacterium]